MSTVQSPETSSASASTEIVKISTALLSVYDKTGVVDLANAIVAQGGTLIASGGTAKALTDAGLDVVSIEEYAGLSEAFGGRVKTLHPMVHAGILARRDVPTDMEELAAGGAKPIDLVCVNLYPFEETVASGASEAERIEKIDVGGPTMIRAAAKNWKHVASVCEPDDVPGLVEEITERGGLSLETRRRLATRAFTRTAAYDEAIRRDFEEATSVSEPEPEDLPKRTTLDLVRREQLRYGENPHQRAALYVHGNQFRGTWDQKLGPALSYNNWIDLVAAAELALNFEEPAAAIIKHTNPCGAAVGPNLTEAWKRALAADPVSAFGGIAAFNRRLDADTAREMASLFLEVVVAPSYDDEALEVLAKKKKRRVLQVDPKAFTESRLEWRTLPGGGVLAQGATGHPVERNDWAVASKKEPTEAQLRDLEFAWIVASSVKSNAIVFAKDRTIVGVGAGQMSRVDSVRIAIDKAQELGHSVAGSVLASDAFFPFSDGPKLALDAGVVAIAQPGGSKRDSDTVELVDEREAVMMFTQKRTFRH